MFKRLLLAALAFVSTYTSFGQTPVWSTDVAPILYNNCATCHRNGGIAPFSLMTYGDAAAAAVSMSAAVLAKHMPPWPPDPTYKNLAHERLLSQQQINTIVNWVSGGTPQGDPNLAPPQPVFNNNGDLQGTPDLITKIPVYTSPANTSDVYRCFVVPTGMMADKFITAFEAIPGNRSIVHHVLVYADTTGICAQLDANSPGPGYTSFGGVGTSNAILLGGWVPGTAPITYPTGFGVRLPSTAKIVIQIHYPAGTAGMVDSTEIHFFFSPTNNVRQVYIMPMLNHAQSMVNGPLSIPANQTKTFTELYTMGPGLNFSLIGIAPHMHYIGRNITVYGVSPTNDTQRLIRINDWDFHWQGFYQFKSLQKVPAGSNIIAHAFYDNTSNNPENPSSPPQPVSPGEATTDEMMIVYFIFSVYLPGDENIIIDSTISTSIPSTYYHGQQLLEVYPNPASRDVTVKYYLEQGDNGSVDIINIEGRVVKSLVAEGALEAGYKAARYEVADLPPGVYHLRLKTSQQVQSRKLLIQR
jgi:hypothetical protein